MNASLTRFVWSGVVAAGLLGAVTSNAHAQDCGCVNATQGLVYESGMPVEVSAESLLQVAHEPSQVINLTVVIQDKAIVIINGEETYTKGTVRPYIVRGLTPGKEYNFVIEGVFKNEQGAFFTATESRKIKAGSQDTVVLKLSRINRPKPALIPVLPLALPPVVVAAK